MSSGELITEKIDGESISYWIDQAFAESSEEDWVDGFKVFVIGFVFFLYDVLCFCR